MDRNPVMILRNVGRTRPWTRPFSWKKKDDHSFFFLRKVRTTTYCLVFCCFCCSEKAALLVIERPEPSQRLTNTFFNIGCAPACVDADFLKKQENNERLVYSCSRRNLVFFAGFPRVASLVIARTFCLCSITNIQSFHSIGARSASGFINISHNCVCKFFECFISLK